tara:strand:- start:1339 stop:2436 length:1098 start_codon:yes stop_codon:yes gene_type:complete
MEDNIFVYKKIKTADNNSYQELSEVSISESFKILLKRLKLIRAPFSYELFPQIVINLKWKFDYLTNIRRNPSLIINDLKYWYDQAEMILKFQEENWINNLENISKTDQINNMEAYNFMWPKSLSDDSKFLSSKKIAELRINQIYELSKKEFNIDPFCEKLILDSGCGPGRYVKVISNYNPKKIIGLDSGKEIIKKNNKDLKEKNISFVNGNSASLPFKDKEFDFVLSAGVLHHVNMSIEKTIPEHSRVLKDGGLFFIFIAGKSGMELDVWDFCHKLLNEVPIQLVHNRFSHSINHLRLQGILDHGFSSYFHTDRGDFEKLLRNNFRDFIRVPGVSGIDVTEELFQDDKYFESRFGSGNLRYICRK